MRKLAMASSAGGSARTEICTQAEGTIFYATAPRAVQLTTAVPNVLSNILLPSKKDGSGRMKRR
jgi:hypothetical protein